MTNSSETPAQDRLDDLVCGALGLMAGALLQGVPRDLLLRRLRQALSHKLGLGATEQEIRTYVEASLTRLESAGTITIEPADNDSVIVKLS